MDNTNPNDDLSSLRIDRDKKFGDRPRRRVWLWVITVLVLAAVPVAYLQLKEKIKATTAVKVAPVRLITGSDAGADLVATGYVVAQRMAEVASKGTGRLVYLGFEEGDQVKQGEVIAQLDNDDMKASLELARARLEQAVVDTLNAGRQYRRQQGLFSSGAVTDVQVEAAETAYRDALASCRAALASVRVAEVNVENTYIKAPFDGTILTKNADVGEVVAPFASSRSSKGSVVTMADMNSLEVEADVSEANIYKVRTGQRCEIVLDAYPGLPYPGYVKKVVPTADRARATVLTKVAFVEKDDRVLPEMSARVNFYLDSATRSSAEEATALVVPKEAITTRDGRKVVFRIDDNYVTAVPITPGRELGKVVEVLQGLKQDDLVVLSPPGKLESGQKIEISS